MKGGKICESTVIVIITFNESITLDVKQGEETNLFDCDRQWQK